MTDWKDKFKVVSICLETNEEIEQDFYIHEYGAILDSTKALKIAYPFISEEYLKFIMFTDGAEIAQCRLYGTVELKAAEERYSEIYPNTNWLPIGHEAGGDPLLLHDSGKVALGMCKSYSGEFSFLAEDFSSFLSEVLMGKRYPSIYRVDETEYAEFFECEREEDPWLKFLIEQKWVQL